MNGMDGMVRGRRGRASPVLSILSILFIPSGGLNGRLALLDREIAYPS